MRGSSEIERQPPRGARDRPAKSGFIAGADVREFAQVRTPDEALPFVRAAHAILAAARTAALPHRRRDQRLLPGRRPRARAGLPSPRVRRRPEDGAGLSGGDARHPSRLRRHGAIRAPDRRYGGDGPDADRAQPAARQGAGARARRSASCPPPSCAPRRARWRSTRRRAGARRSRSGCCRGRRVRGFVARKILAQVARRARREHYPAPYAIVELWRRHGANPRTAYEAEARSVARARLHADLAQPGAGVLPAGAAQGPGGARLPTGREGPRGRRRCHGRRHRRLVRAARPHASRCRTAAWSSFDPRSSARGSTSRSAPAARAKRTQTMARLAADVEGTALRDADVVIEAIFENADAKRALYARLEPRLKEGALLATNTSSIVLDTLADDAGRSGPARRPALLQSRRPDAAGRGHRLAIERTPRRRPRRSPSPAASTSCRCRAAARRASSSIAC